MKIIDNKDAIGSVFLLMFSLFYLKNIFSIPIYTTVGEEFTTARTLPLVLATCTIIACLLQLLFSFANKKNQASISREVKGFNWKPAILLTLLMLAYALFFDFLGFVVATFLFLILGFYILGEKRKIVSTAVAAGLTSFMWGLLTQVFDMYLDTGHLFRLVTGNT